MKSIISNTLPGPSKILDRIWKEQEAVLQRKKLSEVRSSIKKQQTISFSGAIKNLKKEQQQEQRFSEIERENRILLEKMSSIMAKPQSNLYSPPTEQMLLKRSLNREKRKRDLQKIAFENEKILKRLQAKNATYSVEKWQSDYQKYTEYRENINEAPYVFGELSQSQNLSSKIGPLFPLGRNSLGFAKRTVSTAGTNQDINKQILNKSVLEQKLALPQIKTKLRESVNITKTSENLIIQNPPENKPSTSRQQLSDRKNKEKVSVQGQIKQASNLDSSRKILFNEVVKLSQGGKYLIEISRDSKDHLLIAAYDQKSQESFLINLNPEKAQSILQQFNNQYSHMAQFLQVINKRLILLSPMYQK